MANCRSGEMNLAGDQSEFEGARGGGWRSLHRTRVTIHSFRRRSLRLPQLLMSYFVLPRTHRHQQRWQSYLFRRIVRSGARVKRSGQRKPSQHRPSLFMVRPHTAQNVVKNFRNIRDVLCEGQAKLSISSSAVKALILKIAKPGEVLGLTGVVAGLPMRRPPKHSAHARSPSLGATISCVSLRNSSDADQGIVKQLSSCYDDAREQLRTVGLATSAHSKALRNLDSIATHSQPR
jgi:hypothetical protein